MSVLSWNVVCVCYVSCDIHLSLLLLLFLSLSALLFSIVKDCPEEWQRGMSAGLLDPMKPMDTIFVKYVRENGPAVKAGLSTGIYIIRLLNFLNGIGLFSHNVLFFLVNHQVTRW